MPGAVTGLPPATPPAASGRPLPPGAARLHLPAADGTDTRLKAACQNMEALFIHRLLTEMRKSVVKSGLIDGGRAEEIYTSLMDAETATNMAQSGSLGLSRMLFEQLSHRGLADPAPAADMAAAGTRSSSKQPRRP